MPKHLPANARRAGWYVYHFGGIIGEEHKTKKAAEKTRRQFLGCIERNVSEI